MRASKNGHEEVVRILLEYQADITAKDTVRNQMIMMRLIIVITIMIMMIVMIMAVIYEEDRVDCR